MRHRKHNHQLGVKTAHRTSMLANLSCSLIENGRIKTTLARARALRQTVEKIITLAKKAYLAQDPAKKIHYRRLAISRLRSKSATKKLFDELAEQFVNRQGGYTRIYKLALPRLGDAAEMALIEFVEDAKPKKKKKSKKATKLKDVPQDSGKNVSDEGSSPDEITKESDTVADKAKESESSVGEEVVENTDAKPALESPDSNVSSDKEDNSEEDKK
jgi:large subunit ribosomal protein L17